MSKLTQLKEKGENLAAEIMVDATMTLATRGITKKDIKIAKAVTIGSMVAVGAAGVFMFAGNNSSAFDNLATKLLTLLQALYNGIKKIVIAVAIALLAVCIVLSMTSKDERKVTEYKEWGKRIIIAAVIFVILGEITNVIKNMWSGDPSFGGLGG